MCLRDPARSRHAGAAESRPHVRARARGCLGLLAPARQGRRSRSPRGLSAVRARGRGAARRGAPPPWARRRSTARPPGPRSRATRKRSRDVRVSSCSTLPASRGSASRWTRRRSVRRSTRSSPSAASARVAKRGGDPGYRPEERSPQRVPRSASRRIRIPEASEQLDLDRVHRVDVRIAELDRALDDRLPVEQLA